MRHYGGEELSCLYTIKQYYEKDDSSPLTTLSEPVTD